MRMADNNKLENLLRKIPFREKQLKLLYDLLISNPSYSLIHLYGLSGTGKTYTVQNFMRKFCNVLEVNEHRCIHVYLNCSELCYATKSMFFSEIIDQISSSPSISIDSTLANVEDEVEICYNIDELVEMECINKNNKVDLDQSWDGDEIDAAKGSINECSVFLRQLRSMFKSCTNKTSLFLVLFKFIFINNYLSYIYFKFF